MAPLELVKKPYDLAKSFECNVITKTMAIVQPRSSHGIQVGCFTKLYYFCILHGMGFLKHL
jgi:hypothetical protein